MIGGDYEERTALELKETLYIYIYIDTQGRYK